MPFNMTQLYDNGLAVAALAIRGLENILTVNSEKAIAMAISVPLAERAVISAAWMDGFTLGCFRYWSNTFTLATSGQLTATTSEWGQLLVWVRRPGMDKWGMR